MKAIIVDDELAARENLKHLINQHCPQLGMAGTASCLDEADKLMHSCLPDIVFLDIQLGAENGFSILDTIKEIDAEAILVTAYDQYAIEAIECSVQGYLLKPINPSKLKSTVLRVSGAGRRQDHLNGRVSGNAEYSLTVAHTNGFTLVKVSEIVYLKSAKGYTILKLVDGEELVSSRHIKHFEELLAAYGFCRIHKSAIINLECMKEYRMDIVPYAIMRNGESIEVSRRRKPFLLRSIQAQILDPRAN